MARKAAVRGKIPTSSPQLAAAGSLRPARGRAGQPVSGSVLALAAGRMTTRSDDRVVVELGCGVTVYPARFAGDRWRAVWEENGRRRQCESVTEDGLAGRLEPVIERLTADAPNLERPGADLVAFYLCPDRLPASGQWSRKHAHTQARLCERFVLPVIGAVACQDIKVAHMQEIVSATRMYHQPGLALGLLLYRDGGAVVNASCAVGMYDRGFVERFGTFGRKCVSRLQEVAHRILIRT
jgi:hypothetical protein